MEPLLFIANDHAGFGLKKALYPWIKSKGLSINDLGCDDTKEVDYPVYAHKLAQALLTEPTALGILICGSGLGMAMVINKYPDLRAAPCYTKTLARLARAHNNAQVLCLGARHTDTEKAQEIIDAFLSASFQNDGRHARRIQQFQPPVDSNPHYKNTLINSSYEVVVDFTKAIKLNLKHALAYTNRRSAYKKSDQLDKAKLSAPKQLS